MAINTKEEILNAIANMKTIDICDLVKLMEKKFDISSADKINNIQESSNNIKEKKEEKTEYNVILVKQGNNKIKAIKAIRSVTNLGLKDAKNAVESAPYTVKESLPLKEANEMKKILEDAGTTVELK